MKLLLVIFSVLSLGQSYAIEGFKGVITFDDQYIPKKNIVKIHYLDQARPHFHNIDTVELTGKTFIHFNNIKEVNSLGFSNSLLMAREDSGTSGGD